MKNLNMAKNALATLITLNIENVIFFSFMKCCDWRTESVQFLKTAMQ